MSFDNKYSLDATETDETSKCVQEEWDDSTLPSTAVIEAVADMTGGSPMEMPPLYDTLDVEALDTFLTAERADSFGTVSVSFTYDGTFVWISSDGTIEVDSSAAMTQ